LVFLCNELLTHICGNTKTEGKKPPIQKPAIIRAVSLSADDEETLAQLAHEMADRVGRAPSRSTVFRALLRLARDVDVERLMGFLVEEVRAGVRWGRNSQRRPG